MEHAEIKKLKRGDAVKHADGTAGTVIEADYGVAAIDWANGKRSIISSDTPKALLGAITWVNKRDRKQGVEERQATGEAERKNF